LPLEEEYTAVRRQALAPLRALMLDVPPGAAPAVDTEFAHTALDRCTAEEGASLVDWQAVSAAAALRPHPW